MKLEEFNLLPKEIIFAELERCCGSTQWVEKMVRHRPFQTLASLYETADTVWQSLSERDWKEAFSHHPKIGDIESLRKKFSSTKEWAEGEQKGVNSASEETLKELSEKNPLYEEKFGYIFIVCATGKTAEEMLGLLRRRLHNAPNEEITIAAEEQRKITRLRLEKLFSQ